MQGNLKRLKKSSRKEESAKRGFSRLMMMGKLKQALKLINSNSDIFGVHEINDDIREVLKSKHPDPEPCHESALIEGNSDPTVQEVIFAGIDGEMVRKAAEKTFGSGGPTKIDADVWKHILCSKVYQNSSNILAAEIANFAKRLATEDIEIHMINQKLSSARCRHQITQTVKHSQNCT